MPPIKKISEEDNLLNRSFELIAELRQRVEQLERDVYPYGKADHTSPPPKPRKGRKPKLKTEELLQRRMNLTSWLEQNWPRLLIPMRKANRTCDSAIAVSALIAAKESGMRAAFQPPFYDTPKKFEQAIASFFKSGRYHDNPRNLAAAMAGLPELSWKTSFDICTAHPYKTGHMLEAYWDHISRKFRDRLKELDEAKTELDVKIVLARSRTHDPVYLHSKKNPGKVKEWLNAGKPSLSKAIKEPTVPNKDF